jgi:hypothetical protein
VARLYPQELGSLLVASYDSQVYGGGIRIRLQSYITIDGQSTSLSWNKATIWGLRPDFYYCQTVAGLLICGALSYERTGLSFTISAGPRQRSHSRVPAPLGLATIFYCLRFETPLFVASRVTVDVFYPTSTRPKVKVTLWVAVYRQSVCLGVKPLETHDQNFPPPPTEPLR